MNYLYSTYIMNLRSLIDPCTKQLQEHMKTNVESMSFFDLEIDYDGERDGLS